MNRAEHLQWCKDRGLELLRTEGIESAFASMISDMKKHKDTESHIGLRLGYNLLIGDCLNTQSKMKAWIDGFN